MRSLAIAVALLIVATTGCGSEGPDRSTATPAPIATPTASAAHEGTPSKSVTPGAVTEAWATSWDSGVASGWGWLEMGEESLFVAVSPPYDCCDNFSNSPGLVAALDPSTGGERWRFETPSNAFPALLTDGTLIFGTADGTVFGLDPATGAERWSISFPGIPFQVLASDGVVAVGDGDPEHPWGPNGIADKMRIRGHVWGVDPVDGTVLWEHEFGVFGVYLSSDRTGLFVAAADVNSTGFLAALDAPTGDILWRVAAGSASSPPALTGELAIVGETTGPLVAFDRGSGSVVWTAGPESGSGVVYSPKVYGDVLVAPTNTHAIDLRSAATGIFQASGQMGDCGMLPVEAGGEAAYLYCGRLAGIDLAASGNGANVLTPLVGEDLQARDAVVTGSIIYLATSEGDATLAVHALKR